MLTCQAGVVCRQHANFDFTQTIRQANESFSSFSLTPERLHLSTDFRQDVTYTDQVGIRVFKLPLSFPFPDTIFLDARGFLKELTAGFWFCTENGINFRLTHNGVGATANTGIEKELSDVLEPAGRLVNEILRFTITIDPSRNRDFVKVQRKKAVLIVDSERDLSHSHWLTL